MKRFFNSPEPLAFFGFLLTFLLTVAWRVPLQGTPHFFGVAEAATPPPVPVPVPEPVQAPLPIPQRLPMTMTLPIQAIAAAAPTMLPAFAQAAPVTETADVSSLPNAASNSAKKKGRHAHKKIATATPTSDDSLAGLMSAAAEGKPSKKRARHE